MSKTLSVFLVLVALCLLLITLRFIKNGKLPLKYSLIWICISLVVFLSAFLPNWLVSFTNFIGFQTVSNLIIGVMLVVLFVLSMILTIIVSAQKEQIILLTQEISILKSRIDVVNKNE